MSLFIAVILALYVLALPTSMGAMEGLAWLGFLVALAHYLFASWHAKKFISLRIGPDIFLFGFWIVVSIGAIFISDIPEGQRFDIVGSCRFILLIYSFYYLLNQLGNKIYKFWSVFVGAFILLGFFAIVQSFSGIKPFSSHIMMPIDSNGIVHFRPPGFFSNTMTLSYSWGMWLCMFFAGYLCFFYSRFKERRAAFFAACFLLLVVLVLTLTRGAWISFAGAALLMTFLFNKKWAIGTAALGLVSFLILFFTVPQVKERFSHILDQSNQQRINLWKANWAMFLDRPLLGVGYEQNRARTYEYYEKIGIQSEFRSHAHNNYLQVLAGAGIFGLIFYLGFIGWFLYLALQLWFKTKNDEGWLRVIALGSLGAMVYMHIGGMTQCNFQDGEVTHSFVFVSALLLSCYSQTEHWPYVRSKNG